MMSMEQEVYCGVCSDAVGKEIIPEIRVVSISPKPRARLIRHPIESGGTTVDNKVIDPTTLDVHCYVKWADRKAVDTIFEMFRNREYKFYSVVARDGIYANLALVSCPNTQTPQKFDVFEFTLGFQEVMFGTPRNKKKADAANAPYLRSGRIGGALGW